jgi:hypothetical protein
MKYSEESSVVKTQDKITKRMKAFSDCLQPGQFHSTFNWSRWSPYQLPIVFLYVNRVAMFLLGKDTIVS